MAREVPFSVPPSAPVKAVERTRQLVVAIPVDADGMITAAREVVLLNAEGEIVGREQAPTVFRKVSTVKDDPAVVALMEAISAQIDRWAEEDATPKPAVEPEGGAEVEP